MTNFNNNVGSRRRTRPVLTFVSFLAVTSTTAFLINTSTTKSARKVPSSSSDASVILRSSTVSIASWSPWSYQNSGDEQSIGNIWHIPPFPTLKPQTTIQKQQQSRQVKTAKTTNEQKHRDFTIYCDLDGVLVDFEHGVREAFPDVPVAKHEQFPIEKLKQRRMLWDRIESSGSFFERLPWAPGGEQLWNAITSQTNIPIHILTGVPTYEESRIEKFRWCQRELNIPVKHIDMAGPLRLHVPGRYQFGYYKQQNEFDCYDKHGNVCHVITCWSERKHHESKPGAVLIDDRIDLKEAWESKGGIFIHHKTGDVANTLVQLIHHGILDEDEIDLDHIQQEQKKQLRTVSPRDDALYVW